MSMAKQRILHCVCEIKHRCSFQTFDQRQTNMEDPMPSIYFDMDAIIHLIVREDTFLHEEIDLSYL